MTAPRRWSLSGKARYSVPTPTPARSASSGIEASRPRCAKSSLAAARMRARLRSASARRGRDGAETAATSVRRAYPQARRPCAGRPKRNALSVYYPERPFRLRVGGSPWPRRPPISRSAPSTATTSAVTSRASTTWACGGWATTGTRRASARRGSRRPASSTSCSTRERPAAGASTWSRTPRPSRRSSSASTAGATSSATGGRCTGCATASACRTATSWATAPRFERTAAADVA